jgi:hypothetical protein
MATMFQKNSNLKEQQQQQQHQSNFFNKFFNKLLINNNNNSNTTRNNDNITSQSVQTKFKTKLINQLNNTNDKTIITTTETTTTINNNKEQQQDVINIRLLILYENSEARRFTIFDSNKFKPTTNSHLSDDLIIPMVFGSYPMVVSNRTDAIKIHTLK